MWGNSVSAIWREEGLEPSLTTAPRDLYSVCPSAYELMHVSMCPFARMHIPVRVLFLMYKKLFLVWPSKSYGVRLCCLCAPACVIRFEWMKPRDTSVAFFRLQSVTVCRWFFDGPDLGALHLKGCIPARGNAKGHTVAVVCVCVSHSCKPMILLIPHCTLFPQQPKCDLIETHTFMSVTFESSYCFLA